MLRITFFFFSTIIILSFSSCTDHSLAEKKVTSPSASFFKKSKNTNFQKPSQPLSVSEYQQWLKEQTGITFDESENDKIYLNILYKPLNFEAASSGGYTSDKNLQKYIEIKKGYEYFKIECLDKNTSLTQKTDKEFLFSQIKNNLIVIKNGSDTVYNSIIEIFPAKLINQPHQILMMIPSDDSLAELKAKIIGKPFGLKDLEIKITKNQFKSFPEIKL